MVFGHTENLTELRNAIIALMYVVLFGTACFDKLKSMSVPSWFIEQFSKTFLGRYPLAVTLSYWSIAIFELALVLMFLFSLWIAWVLPFALIGAMGIFVFLLFGIRLIGDYQGSANMFTYFGISLLCLFVL